MPVQRGCEYRPTPFTLCSIQESRRGAPHLVPPPARTRLYGLSLFNSLRNKLRTGGRRNSGDLTIRHHGGGHKKKLRLIDFKREKYGVPGTVAGLARLGYEVINLGSNGPFKLNEAVALVEQATSHKANIVYAARDPSDVLATWANIEKASRLLNWSPQVGFAAGIDRLVRWYRDNRAWAKDIATE